MNKSFKDNIIEHMEFLGYEVTQKTGEPLTAIHKKHLNFMISFIDDFAYFANIYLMDENKVINGKEELLNTINEINADIILAHCTLINSSTLIFGATYIADYTKASFARFMEVLAEQVQKQVTLHIEEIKKFESTR